MAEVEDLDDSWIRDRGGRAGFVAEPRHDVLLGRELGKQNFYRRASTEHGVLGEPDLTHPACADPLQDSIRTYGCPFEHPREDLAAPTRPSSTGWKGQTKM